MASGKSYNESTLDDLVRVEEEAKAGGIVDRDALAKAREAAHKAIGAQLDTPHVMTRSEVRTLYWKHTGTKPAPAPTLPKVKQA